MANKSSSKSSPPSTLEHQILWSPGHDCIHFHCKFGSRTCKPKSGGSHGVKGLNIYFIVKGNKAAVQFLLSTGWQPEPSLNKELGRISAFPYAVNIVYHSPTRRYKGQTKGKCDILSQGYCYSDAMYLDGPEIVFDELCNHGVDAVWVYLEQYYRYLFEKGELPQKSDSNLIRRG